VQHREVWREIVAVADEIDPTVDEIYHRVTMAGTQGSLGGREFLLELHRQAIRGIPLEGFGRAIRAKSEQRRLWTLNSTVTNLLESGSDPASAEIRNSIEELAAWKIPACSSSGAIQRIEDLPAVSAVEENFSYIRNPELPCGAVVALTGDSGSGKSTLATAGVRDAIADGRPCLVLNRENPRTVVQDRMRRIGVMDGPLLRWFGGWLGEVPGPDWPALRSWVEKCELKPLIVIDSLIAFIGGDENDALVMRAFYAPSTQIGRSGSNRDRDPSRWESGEGS